MSLACCNRRIQLLLVFILVCYTAFANADLFNQAKAMQHEGKYDEAIEAFRNCLLKPLEEKELSDQQMFIYSEALVQLMNTYQSEGKPEACITTLKQVFRDSPVIQTHCLRDYYSVLGYALSRTENMKEAEEVMLKAFTIPLHNATPERYFRDYAYAAAVFYANPKYQKEVVDWCQEALLQAQLCKKTSGKQWVMAMLGSLYKRNGHISKALKLYRQSKEEAQERNDYLGVLNSLHALVDLFLYWDVPEYANLYASEAIQMERSMTTENPMVSAQTYIDKGQALLQSGKTDSVSFYVEKAKELCEALPYNSGMVDVDLLCGTYLYETGGDSLHYGILQLQRVAQQATLTNRAKAYHQLAQIYLSAGENDMAETMLDSLYTLLNRGDSPIHIRIDYQPVIEYYLSNGKQCEAEQYSRMMLQEHQTLKEKRLNYNLVGAIAEQQTEQYRQELKITRLGQTNQLLWFLLYAVLSVVAISVIVSLLFYQKKRHRVQMKFADEKLAQLVEKLNISNTEKDKIAQEICELLNDMDKRQELATITPSMLQNEGETKFRQRFELLYPLFLPRLRERVSAITRREELLAMLLVLKQDNREIAELLAIAPRSVLMLRHRFRQKIGLDTDKSLESFIEDTLEAQNDLGKEPQKYSDTQNEDSSTI